VCGAGATLFIDKHDFFFIKYGVGQGPNNKDDFFFPLDCNEMCNKPRFKGLVDYG